MFRQTDTKKKFRFQSNSRSFPKCQTFSTTLKGNCQQQNVIQEICVILGFSWKGHFYVSIGLKSFVEKKQHALVTCHPLIYAKFQVYNGIAFILTLFFEHNLTKMSIKQVFQKNNFLFVKIFL